MSDLEAGLEKFFFDRVRLVGGVSYKIAPTTAGIPDRLVIFPYNRMWLVELKTNKGQLSPIQLVLHERLWDEFGVTVVTLYGKEHILDWIRKVVSATDPEIDQENTVLTAVG